MSVKRMGKHVGQVESSLRIKAAGYLTALGLFVEAKINWLSGAMQWAADMGVVIETLVGAVLAGIAVGAVHAWEKIQTVRNV